MDKCILIALSLALVAIPMASSSPSSMDERMSNMERVLENIEEWLAYTDAEMQRSNVYKYRYGPWSACSATCGIGYKTRVRRGCDPYRQSNCTQRLYCNPRHCPDAPRPKKTRYATCAVLPNEELGEAGSVRGVITFTQTEHGAVVLTVNVTGFDVLHPDVPEAMLDHGFHIHQFGDINGGCGAAGPHYNPTGMTHGAREASVRHRGDLGNIRQNFNGTAFATIVDERISLFGSSSIIGRTAIIHKNQDDLGLGGDDESLLTGNAGARLACCVVGIIREE